MTNSRDLILKIKEINAVKNLSHSEIEAITEKNGEHVSRTSISRVFAKGSENEGFSYEGTLKPIANALLDFETIEEDDDLNTQGLKTTIQFKGKEIERLEAELDKADIKYHEKLDKEREQYNKRIEFLMKQIDLKDKRIDQLFEAVFEKDKQHKEMLIKLLKCQRCPNNEMQEGE